MIKSKEELKELNKTVQSFKRQGIISESIGTADFPIRMKIQSINNHAAQRMKERGITKEEAQLYIDNAMIMFKQSDDSKRLYISSDGNSAVLVEGGKLISAYSSKDFDEGIKKIIEEVQKYD